MIVRELITKIGFTVDSTKLKEANFTVGKFKRDTEKLTGNLKQAATGIRNVGVGLTAALTLPILGLGLASVKAAGDIEMLTTDFETLLGSAEKGSKMVDDIRKMAARTPFGTTDLARSSKTLLAFGVNAERTLPILNRIGDVASGNKERMKSLALVYGQVTANQKLMGQDLLQFINAGFNPLLEISTKTGESMKSLRERMSKGEIGIDLVQQAFVDATSEGGRFYKGMERGSKTLQGRLSTLKDVFLELLASFGDVALPTLKAMTIALTNVARLFTDMPKPLKIIIGLVAGLVAAIGPLLFVGGQLAIMILSIKLLLASTTITLGAILAPIGLVVGAMAGIAVAATLIINYWSPIKGFFEDIFQSVNKAIGAVFKFQDFLDSKALSGLKVAIDYGKSVGDKFTGNSNKNLATTTNRAVNQNINMKLDSKVEMPAGTPAEIQSYADTAVRKTVEETFNSMLRQTDANVSFAGGAL